MKGISVIMTASIILLTNIGGQYTNPIGNMTVEAKAISMEPMVREGNWLYKSGKLSKVHTDGTNKSYLGQNYGSIIDVVDGWVYYVDQSIGQPISRGIYKIKNNEVVRVTNDNYIIDAVFYKGAIYYALGPKMADNYIVKSGLYKVDIDGKNKVQLSDQQVNNINIDKDCIYYSGESSVTEGNRISIENPGIFKMNTDGTSRIKIYDKSAQFLKVSEDNIYFSNSGDEDKLYKISTDGRNIKKLNDDNSWDIKVNDNWIYYTNNPYDGHIARILPLDQTRGNIYKITIDGKNRTKLNSEASRLVEVLDGWIYYGNWSDKLYKIKLDGSNKSVVE